MTADEVAQALKVFGNYRVLRTQQIALPTFFRPSVCMALGLRESTLRNINGGAKWEHGEWVASKSDHGCFQISEASALGWLESVPGCPEGSWRAVEDRTAGEAGYCPRFTDALIFVLGKAEANRRQALKNGVALDDVLRFCVAAHNAGFSGALKGYKNGDVDENTAHNDYSAWVMAQAAVVHNWVVSHPGWVYHGHSLLHAEPGTEAF